MHLLHYEVGRRLLLVQERQTESNNPHGNVSGVKGCNLQENQAHQWEALQTDSSKEPEWNGRREMDAPLMSRNFPLESSIEWHC